MAKGLILDTSVVVAAARKMLNLRTVVGDDDPAISAWTAMELLTGIDKAAPPHRDIVALDAEAWLAVMPILDYTLSIARANAFLVTHTRQTGLPRGAIDLVIAATACATGRTLLTTDAKAEFDQLPGVRAEVVKVR